MRERRGRTIREAVKRSHASAGSTPSLNWQTRSVYGRGTLEYMCVRVHVCACTCMWVRMQVASCLHVACGPSK